MKGSPYTLLVGMYIAITIMENIMAVPQKSKNWTTYDSAILFLVMCAKKSKSVSQRSIFTPRSTATLFTIAKIQKQAKCSSTEKWIKKMGLWNILSHEKEGDPAFCNNIVLNGMSQTKTNTV